MGLGVKMAYIEQSFGGFQKGNLYAIATRPGVGKTHFCMSVSCHFLRLYQHVLYISDSMNEMIFEKRLDAIHPFYYGKQVFKECYKLTTERLSEWLDADSFDLLVIDPFDVFCWDIDIGELKELAKEKNVCVLLSKNLSASDEPPALSHIRFPSEKVLDKFLAYTDVILFGYPHPKNDTVCVNIVKNVYGSLLQTLEFYK